MAQLVLGPLLRYVGDTEAVIWVETDEPCEVEVLGHADRTFCVAGHHFGLVIVEGLEPGPSRAGALLLGLVMVGGRAPGPTPEWGGAPAGPRRWPEPESDFPPS